MKMMIIIVIIPITVESMKSNKCTCQAEGSRVERLGELRLLCTVAQSWGSRRRREREEATGKEEEKAEQVGVLS